MKNFGLNKLVSTVIFPGVSLIVACSGGIFSTAGTDDNPNTLSENSSNSEDATNSIGTLPSTSAGSAGHNGDPTVPPPNNTDTLICNLPTDIKESTIIKGNVTFLNYLTIPIDSIKIKNALRDSITINPDTTQRENFSSYVAGNQLFYSANESFIQIHCNRADSSFHFYHIAPVQEALYKSLSNVDSALTIEFQTDCNADNGSFVRENNYSSCLVQSTSTDTHWSKYAKSVIDFCEE